MKHNQADLKHGDVIECGDVEGLPRSEFIPLQSGTGAFGRRIQLCKVTRGYRLAGSCCTWNATEYFAYNSYDRDGTRQSRGYKTITEAQKEFDTYTYTTPITARTGIKWEG